MNHATTRAIATIAILLAGSLAPAQGRGGDVMPVRAGEAIEAARAAYRSGDAFRPRVNQSDVGPAAPREPVPSGFEDVRLRVEGRGPDIESTLTLASFTREGDEAPTAWVTLGGVDPLGILVEPARIVVVRLDHPGRAFRQAMDEGEAPRDALAELLPPIALPQLHLTLGALRPDLLPQAGPIQWLTGSIDLAEDPDHTIVSGASDRGVIELSIGVRTRRLDAASFTTHDDAHRIRLTATPSYELAAAETEHERLRRERATLGFAASLLADEGLAWVETLDALWDAPPTPPKRE
jgi:hypothetical protein